MIIVENYHFLDFLMNLGTDTEKGELCRYYISKSSFLLTSLPVLAVQMHTLPFPDGL
jgi:hypothetical protein